MPEQLAPSLWRRVREWFVASAQHVTVKFIADQAAEPIEPHNGYVRLWLSEGFLAQQWTWGNQHFPALHGGVRLTFLSNEPAMFTRFDRTPDAWTTPGAHLDFPITALLPFNGGTVEVEAALYQATVGGPLGAAVQFASSLLPLMGPPLSAAAAIAEKVSDGLDSILAAAGNQPVLALHWTMVAPGGGGNPLRQGHVAVVGAPEQRLGGTLSVHDGRLHVDRGGGPSLLAGLDYLVVRMECRRDRDDWRLPELDALIRGAGEAYIRGRRETFADMRTDAIARAWNSTDLAPTDRKRVALLVQQEIDGLGDLGAVPGPDRSLEVIAPQRLVSTDDPRLRQITLAGLLGSGAAPASRRQLQRS